MEIGIDFRDLRARRDGRQTDIGIDTQTDIQTHR